MSRNLVGKIRVNVDVSLLQFKIGFSGIRARVSRLGETFCLWEFWFKKKNGYFF